MDLTETFTYVVLLLLLPVFVPIFLIAAVFVLPVLGLAKVAAWVRAA